MDTLSRVLDLLRFNGTFYYATNFNPPWGFAVPAYKQVARFHYVTQGHCWVRIHGLAEAKYLSAGDLIIVPHGAAHILSDTASTNPIPLDEAVAQAGYEGQGIFHFGEGLDNHDTQLVCGHFEFNEQLKHPLIDALPTHIICNENAGTELSWLKDSLRFLAHVAQSEPVGSSAIIKRLSEIIFIQSIRFWHNHQSSKNGFLAALNDAKIAKGLLAFHNNIGDNWSVEKLSDISSMSRSLFSERFKSYLGISPMQYVTQWRMQNAQSMLRETNSSLENIAIKTGYESLASFSKAFKRTLGQSPGEYRKEQQT